jgi:glutathione S-transferase
MLTLYRGGNSICTQKIVITLLEKAVPRETVNINPIQEQYDPAYLKVNPKGVGSAMGKSVHLSGV